MTAALLDSSFYCLLHVMCFGLIPTLGTGNRYIWEENNYSYKA